VRTSPPGAAGGNAPPGGVEAQAPSRGWAIVIASALSKAEAESVLQRERARVPDADLSFSIAPGGGRHRVVIGPFPSQVAASAALSRLSGWIPTDAWLLEI
jgi:cell division septation protein DedD